MRGKLETQWDLKMANRASIEYSWLLHCAMHHVSWIRSSRTQSLYFVFCPCSIMQKRPYAIGAGSYLDPIFKEQTLVRPGILSAIMRQRYAILWTDTDIVWLGNPLPLLPDLNDPLSVSIPVIVQLGMYINSKRATPTTGLRPYSSWFSPLNPFSHYPSN